MNCEHIDRETIKMEVNLDDMPGEWLGHVMDILFECGAKDVFYIPIYMKKNRPGTLLTLLCDKKLIDKMKKAIFKETTTLGIRYYPLTVHRMKRIFLNIDTKWGTVSVKQGILNGEIMQISPEFDDCKKIANTHSIPIKKVYAEVWGEIQNKF